MFELPLDYLNSLAKHTILINALLCGFSLTVLVLLLNEKDNSRIRLNIFRASTVATSMFIISIFSMTRILLMTTEGFPFEVSHAELKFPRIVGVTSFILGILSVNTVVALTGWIKSKSMGIFTTVTAAITFILVFMMM